MPKSEKWRIGSNTSFFFFFFFFSFFSCVALPSLDGGAGGAIGVDGGADGSIGVGCCCPLIPFIMVALFDEVVEIIEPVLDVLLLPPSWLR
ncbi:hypothetical protein BDF19DRAFT_431555, partial [Syncephalis fuscata]